ncbi:MAG: alpha/beta hydrolase [Candidatus Omnitrophica bacterium]|nr:alpha/beta hydrolase [Candidatus Omnitrophota bacterium]
MLKITIYLIGFFILFVLYVRLLESKSVFYPVKFIETMPSQFGMDFEDVFFKTPDELSLNGWLVKSSDAAATVIFFHGNAGNISNRIPKIKMFKDMGLNVFIIDYRGYGNSEGTPTEAGIYQDAIGAYDYLTNRKDIDSDKLIVYGASLGGAVAVDLAAKRKVGAVILDSTFTSAAEMAKKILPFVPGFLIQTKLDSIGKIKGIKCPKLFIHSKEDEIVPFAYGLKLYEAALPPKKFLQINGGHNEGFADSGEAFPEGIKEFLKGINLI